ncbi:hemerythrin domain-containing protein [Streptomyces sp. B1866]|uniref:hemerythrin domain-containing protein n=1 Tax=Streptomyces sp. B1866 TaxID=3075431 RepID=UPI00288D8D02|nr:hemerythrin domain-containing protein [Streptomyces sp. B1866]MDT3399243.1 hemerythrin domain-containing protein [Streptomyces sp. B1866]
MSDHPTLDASTPDAGQWPARAPQLAGAVDFTMMFAAHDAFTRHLRRLRHACGHDRILTPRGMDSWRGFTRQLHLHHTTEDTALWPPLRERLATAGGLADLAVLDDMEREHLGLDPLLDRVEAALAARDAAAVADLLGVLTANLTEHMRHEERAALPLIERHLGAAGWAAFERSMRRTQGLRGASTYLPWLLDGAPAATQAAVQARLPAPARLLNRRVWTPRYRRSGS